MRNRIISIMLACTLVVTMVMPINAIAETGTAVSMSLSNNAAGTLDEGDQVTITLNVGTNSGVNGMQVYITYDSNAFSYVSSETLDSSLSITCNGATAGKVSVAIVKNLQADIFSNTGNYLTFTLAVKSGVSSGNYTIGFSTTAPDNTAYTLSGTTYDIESLANTSVNVNIPATGVSLTAAGGATSIAGIGNTLQMTAAVEPSNAAQPASQSDYTWISSSTSVATVSSSGLVTAVGAGTTNITASYGGFTSNIYAITVNLATLSGTVSVTGTAKVGETLTGAFTPSDSEPSSGVVYNWYVGGSSTSGGSGSTYLIKAADVGQTIVCTATHPDYSGSVSSSATAAVTAADQTAPADPTLNSNTDASITINASSLPGGAPAGATLEYGITATEGAGNVGSWSASLTFSGLDADKTYYIYARCAAITGYNASPASDVLTVTTDKTTRSLSVDCDPTAGGTAEIKVNGVTGTTAVAGDTITVVATPNSDYYFSSGWSDNAESGKVTFTIVDTHTATFTMPDRDVSIKATFTEKTATVISGASDQTSYVYDGTAKAYDLTGVTVKEGSDTGAVVSGASITVAYYNGYDGNAPTTAALTGAPSDAGDYTAVLSFAGDETHKAATVNMKLTINNASQSTPAVPTVSDITTEGFTYTPVIGQAYAITASATAPAAGDSAWGIAAASADAVTVNNLNPGSTYYLHTYLPAKANYNASAAATSAAINTLDTFSFAAAPTSVNFFSRTGASSVDNAETITITTSGTGTYDNISAALSGTGAGSFELGTLATSAAANGTLTFTVAPKSGTNLSTETTYTAVVTVSYNEVGEGASGSAKQVTVNVTYEVKDKIEVTINPVGTAADGKYPYTASSVTPYTSIGAATYTPVDGVAAFDETYEYLYTGTGSTSYSSATAPTNAGTYQLVISVPDTNPDYTGSKTIAFEITPKELTITGLTAADKVYDGTTAAAISGGTLNGVIAADAGSVSATMPTAGTFSDKNVGTGKTVTFALITLSGTQAVNYSLTQPASLSADITPKPVTAAVTIEDKTYDATTDAAAQVSVSSAQLCSGDSLTITGVTASFTNAGAGMNKAVSVVITSAGWGNDNYQVTIPTSATGNILKRALNITFSASYTETYDGSAKTVELTVAAADATTGLVGGDTAAATARTTYAKRLTADPTYDTPTSSAPVLAGTYKLGAEVINANYQIGTVTDPALLTINKGTLTLTPQTYSVAFDNTIQQSKSLSDLALTPSVAGAYTIDTYSDADGILTAAPAIESGSLRFTLASGLTDTSIGKTAAVTVRFTPSAANTYNEQTAVVTITLADDTYTNSIVGTLPTEIKLGQDIDFTGVKLRTVFGSGIPTEELLVTDNTKVTITNNYDKTATGAGALGNKTIVFTAKDNANRTYTHTVNVVDALSGSALTIHAPTKLAYDVYTASALDLAGGTFSPVWVSTLTTGANSAMTASMLTYPDNMTAAEMLSTLGTHTVTVTYTYGGDTQTATFDVTVSMPASAVGTSPSGTNVGVQENPTDAAVPMTYSTTGGPVSASAVVAALGALPAGAEQTTLNNLATAQNGFAGATEMSYYTLGFSSGGNAVTIGGGTETITIPYPYGSDSGDMFAMIVRYSDGTSHAVVPTRTQDGLTFDVSGDVTIALGWYTPQTDTNTPEPITQTQFWQSVRTSIQNAPKGATITAYSGFFDQMPVDIMTAVKQKDVTLVINSAWGKTITIDSTNALTPELGRVYYPLSYLFENLKDSTRSTMTDGTAYGTVTLLLPPQTGDDTVVLQAYSMTDMDEGFLEGLKTADVTENTVIDDGIVITEGAQPANGSFYYGFLLIALGLLTAGAARLLSDRKKRRKAN